MEISRATAAAARQKTDEAKVSVAANKSENAVLNTLTKLKMQGRLKGFHVSNRRFGDGHDGAIMNFILVQLRAVWEISELLMTNTMWRSQRPVEH
jgi:structural maintenance of chromosome 4